MATGRRLRPQRAARAAASAGLGRPGGAGRGLQPPVHSGARSAALLAFGRTEERAGDRSRGAIEAARRAGRRSGWAQPKSSPPGWADIGERGRGLPPHPKAPFGSGRAGKGRARAQRVLRSGRGARGPTRASGCGAPSRAAGNFARAGTAGLSGRYKLSGGRGTPGIAASAGGWRWCPRLLCVTSGPGPRVHRARPRGSPPFPQPGPGGRARPIVCIPRVTPGRERF